MPEKSVICSDSTRRLRGLYEGVLTGKGLSYGGSLARTEATGYGLLYFTRELLKLNGIDIAGKTACVSGSGNVAIYAVEKATQMGVKVLTVSDSTGWVYDPEGIDVAALKEIKEVKRARLTEYKNYRPNSEYHEGRGVWTVKCDLALPCATQNELLLEDAKALVANGCLAVCEGANMPTTLDATEYLQKNNVIFAPGKAANAGGVATSALEMSQNSERLSWTFEEVDAKLQQDHDQYLPQCRRCCKALRYGRQLCSRRKHCRIRKSCRCYERTGYCLIFQYPLYQKRTGEQTKWFVPQLFY